MKRIQVGMVLLAISLCVARTANAQMGMNLFQKPAIAKFLKPVVGKGAQYEMTFANPRSESSRSMEMGVLAKESVDGKEGYWMQIVMTNPKGEPILAKSLITKDDFQTHKMIMQMPGKPAMEMPFNPSMAREQKMEESMNEWHLLGTETITVPAGTFVCEHYRNESKGSDFWASEKVSPFGMVKSVSKNETMVLTKLLNDVPDRIPGPVTKFDPHMMMQQHQQKP